MHLGNITQKEIDSCHFYQYGTTIPVMPEIIDTAGDGQHTKNPWGNGSVYWNWQQIMDTGVDAVICLKKEYFVDHITLKFARPSQVTLIDGEKKVLGFGAGEEILFTIAKECKEFTLRLQGQMQDILLEEVTIGACLDKEAGLYPIPANTVMKKGRIFRRELGRVIYTENKDGQELAAQRLTEKAEKYLGLKLTGSLPITLKIENTVKSENYRLSVTESGITVAAGERKGFLYGTSKLLQLLLWSEEIPCCEIEDGPFTEFRGFHMGLPPREEFSFYKRLIRDLLVPMGYNTLFLQVTAGMRFKKHPELNEAWVEACRKSDSGEWPILHHSDMIAGGQVLEQEEVAELVEYAAAYGMEVIPEIQSLGHVQYITLAHPELAEVSGEEEEDIQEDERLADQPPAAFYKHSYCPSNEESYKLIFDIIDEIVDVMKPARYVHMGHDEVYQIGICPKCKEHSPAELFVSDVTKIYNHLKEKNLGMMIWSDMIQTCSSYETRDAIDMLPRDIVMLDFIWYFHLDLDLEDNLLERGYTVLAGNLYSSHYPRYEHRIRKAGMRGGEVSTWCRPDEYVLGRNGKLYDLLYTAGMLWSEKYDSAYRETYNEMIQKLLPWIRADLHGKGLYPSLKSGADEKLLKCTNGEETLNSKQLQMDFSDCGFDKTCQINSGEKAEYDGENRAWESLVFYHAAVLNEGKKPFEELKRIGQYVIQFTDGSREKVDIEYGGNIGCISERYAQPLAHPYFRHTGYSATYFTDPVKGKDICGRDRTLYRLEWINTEEKEISRIVCEGEDCGGILLAGIGGI